MRIRDCKNISEWVKSCHRRNTAGTQLWPYADDNSDGTLFEIRTDILAMTDGGKSQMLLRDLCKDIENALSHFIYADTVMSVERGRIENATGYYCYERPQEWEDITHGGENPEALKALLRGVYEEFINFMDQKHREHFRKFSNQKDMGWRYPYLLSEWFDEGGEPIGIAGEFAKAVDPHLLQSLLVGEKRAVASQIRWAESPSCTMYIPNDISTALIAIHELLGEERDEAERAAYSRIVELRIGAISILGYAPYPDTEEKLPAPPSLSLPDELNTDEAKFYFDKAVKAGLLTPKTYQPTKQYKGKKALLAYFAAGLGDILNRDGHLCKALFDGEKGKCWQPFERLWGLKGLAKSFYIQKGNKSKPRGAERVDEILSVRY